MIRAAIIALACAPALACVEQEPATYALGAASMAAHAVDWAQTRTIVEHPHRFAERNPMLGEHPSAGQVNRHFAAVLVVDALALCFLPKSAALPFFAAVTVVSVGNVTRNHFHAGIRVSF